MSKRRGLPFGVMALLLILALAAIGVGYGLWSQTLIINGFVHTWEMDSGLSSRDRQSSPTSMISAPTTDLIIDCDRTAPERRLGAGQDVAECTTVLDDYTMEVVVTLPGFNCFIKWDVPNTGASRFISIGRTTSTAACTREALSITGAARERVAPVWTDGRSSSQGRLLSATCTSTRTRARKSWRTIPSR
jgi:hypothetical protein